MTPHAIILAGGSGTRLWPLSQPSFPKHLLTLHGDMSLLQQTASRLLPQIPAERIITVTHKDHLRHAQNQLKKISPQLAENILAEPEAKNTLPAIAWAVSHISSLNPQAIIGVFPSDHIIDNPNRFHSALKEAFVAASEGYLVTFGVQPTFPATGYGYIETGDFLGKDLRTIKSFTEKPDEEKARSYLKKGRYYWNAGLFAFSVKTFQEELKKYHPSLYDLIKTIKPGKKIDEIYGKLPSLSIDYGLMEKTSKGVVIPVDMDWNDLGSWEALYEIEKKDKDKNVTKGKVLALDTHSSLLLSNKKLIATIGLENIVVIETDEAILVSSRDRVQDVKKIVERLKKESR
ncbi:MAG: mannose-1-phosphate guanylyltransferase [bacterium]|nr:mannose-1-phosphate guanylyltransferase [bacterium]